MSVSKAESCIASSTKTCRRAALALTDWIVFARQEIQGQRHFIEILSQGRILSFRGTRSSQLPLTPIKKVSKVDLSWARERSRRS
jgi:hypothetical protein